MRITRYSPKSMRPREVAATAPVAFTASRPEGASGWTVTLRADCADGTRWAVALTDTEARELVRYLNRLVFPA